MQAKKNTTVDRIIAKIDNDFNLDNTDWIPRVPAWIIDALSIIKCTPTKKVKTIAKVIDRIAYINCNIDLNDIKVYNSKGCEIKSFDEINNGCQCIPSTGGLGDANVVNLSNTMSYIETGNKNDNDGSIAIPDGNQIEENYYIANKRLTNKSVENYYIIVDCNKLELNFDDTNVCIEYNGIETEYSEFYGCAVPVIPNNGLLIEAIVYYCMYKMLCRGYKHPVFNLQASQYGTNPYYLWINLKDKAKRSVINGENEFDDKHAWDYAMRDFMFN